ncbi:DUF421 domain-containing protein [Pseudobacteroides cellulosolvens]|uniref:YetF C-terminal domain-containing protein n=1 Tax=Pseudobacteroides cellulosolvens ATCC 35603 = DSM 2933 TaxID=398512 RepID=A0A0L6JII8_9FIRM|nr:DUF421 domain-containing protein [Pseudobacteroides cellulosolvens]KNY25671.1 protein of unknown function DUF421 [Pseudobacteroides cellulosolvens ATCC 35603 = DSM 2933]
MEAIIYIFRCVLVLLFSWFCVRVIGKKSISQLTSYDFTALMILANVAAEPLVFKVSSKAFLGSVTIAVVAVIIGRISLNKIFYNIDAKPDIIIVNGKIDKNALKRNRMNLPFLLSLLRLQGYTKVSDVEFAIIEPDGNLSVIPTSQSRPVTPNDLKIDTPYEGITLPLIIDGEIQYNNLKFAKLDKAWLKQEILKSGASKAEDIFLAELDTSGKLNIDLYKESPDHKPGII